MGKEWFFSGEEKSDFGLNKKSYLENYLFYLNKAYLIVQKYVNKLYADHVTLGQIIAAANSPDDTET